MKSLVSRFLFAATSLAVIAGCGRHEAPQEKTQAIPVRVERIESRQISEKTQLVGWMDSRKSIDLYPRITGYVKKIYVSSGQEVGQGQLMFVVDPTRQQAAVASAKSEVELAAADLAKEKGELKSLQSERNALKARLDYASLQYDRFYWLEKKNVVAQAEVDTHDTAKKVSEADIQALDDKILAQQDVIVRAKKRLDAKESELAEQKTILDYYYIKAPFAGTVGDLPAKEGDYVEPKNRLTSVSQTSPLEINANVPKEYARQLRQGVELDLIGPSGNVVAKCPIFYVAPTIDPKSQSVLVKAVYPNVPKLFRPDQSIEVRVIFSRESGLTVPTEALSSMAGKPFVFIAVTGGNGRMIARQRALSLSNVEENRAVVKSGLKSGELVVTSGVQNLYDGTPIQIEQ